MMARPMMARPMVIRPMVIRAWARAAGAAGFTILELVIAVAVLGILLGVGVPSFNAMVRQNRLASKTNDLLAAAALVRSEAVKRGTLVTLCPADPANVNRCSGDDAWSNGWIAFTDDQGTVGTIDIDASEPNDLILERWPASTPQRIVITNAGALFLSYRGDGATTLAPGAISTFTVAPEPDYCESSLGARQVTVAAIGRVNTARINCP